ncbi:MAG: alpha amylase C-terminal domain-containing protein, partial [Ilumatobacteraceae bacterium]
EWNDASELPWHLLDHAAHRGVHDVLQAMNAVADEWPALWARDTDPGGFEWLDADDASYSTYAFVRWDVDGASAVVCIANLTPVPRPGFRVGLPWGGGWQVVLDTDAAAWWGSGHRGTADVVVAEELDEPYQGQSSSAVLDVGPMSMVWLAAASPGA